MIDNLVRLTPDESRSARTVARCHERLAARRRKIEARRSAPRSRAMAERMVIAGVCVAYLISMAGELLAIAGRR